MNGYLIASLLVLLASPVAASAQPAANPLGLKPHHITASVVDIDRAVQWYVDMLGFKVVNRATRPNGMKGAELDLDGFGIGLVQTAGAQEAAAEPARPPRPPYWVHMVFSVPNPDDAFNRLKARGAKVTTRQAAAGPIRTFLLFDSEGNEIEIVAP